MRFKDILSAEFRKSTSTFRLALLTIVPFLVAISLFMMLLVIWEKRHAGEDQLSELKEVARAFFGQIMVTRTWNALHGGVYTEVSETTRPNPYLEDPRRDIVCSDGTRFTKINPAYMTRQLSELTSLSRGYSFRLVSLKPVNPKNSPDAWEKDSLIDMEKRGTAEASTVYAEHDGRRFFKFLSPLRIEKPCLTCHASHGYKVGDIKGGISILVPMAQSDQLYTAKTRRTVLYILAVGTVSFLFITMITCFLSRRLSGEIEKNIDRERLTAIVELAGATAHEMRQPMTVIHNLVGLMNEKTRQNEPITEEEMMIIHDQCDRMNDTINKMLNITSYKTKDYFRGTKIVDFDSAAAPGREGGENEGEK
ncbi:MAG: DUF3365 domain-containing protein [Alphaproteobacteria bacterium]|uniref:histidine kinase n=1 Tax=Candidatus Nitrobium versatile TaxID=2884831 RepID=A0A953J3E5_9BACT|nr:DUF3365 domain-containing protein [Candidatus Nitrobium versatile]